MGFLNLLFGKSNNAVADYITKDAIILDVRNLSEYKVNNIPSAIHIPLPELENKFEEIKKLNQPVIAHCASGIRSASAASFLKSQGIDAINGGGIVSLKKTLGKS